MSDPRPDPAFVEALLAQERAVSPERYAEYRRALDRKIEEAAAQPARRSPRRRRGVVLTVAIGVAAAVAAVLLLRPWGDPPERDTPPADVPEVVVLRSPLGQDPVGDRSADSSRVERQAGGVVRPELPSAG